MGVNYQLRGKNIYLDANIFIYMLEGYLEFVPILQQIFQNIDNGTLYGTTSELTLAETLVKPMADKNVALQKIYQETIQTSAVLQICPVSRDVLIAAAKLRNNTFRLPDAIHLATAYLTNCQTFLTNDKRLKTFMDVNVVLLSEIKNSTLIMA